MTAPSDLARHEHWHRQGYLRAAHHASRFVALVRRLDADQLAAPVPGLDWDVLDVVAHVCSVCRRYTVNRRRAQDHEGVAVLNAADIEGLSREAGALTDEIEAQVAAMAFAVDHVDPDRQVQFHAGQTLSMAGAWGNLIGELLAHGDDVARATGSPWTVDGADLEPFWRYTTRAMPGWFTAEGARATDSWELRLGFPSGPVRLRFTGGGLVVDEPDPPPADHVVAGDPATTALTVPYRRRPATDPGLAVLGERIAPL